MNCPVKTETVADFIRTVVNSGWKIKRIINNDTHADKAICLLYCGEETNLTWVRAEIETDEIVTVFYFHTDEYNFVDYYYNEVYETVKDATEELCLINS